MATDVSFASIADLLLSEGDSGTSTYSILVKRSGDLTLSSSIAWELRWSEQYSHPTAWDFADNLIPTGTLSFAAGESSKNITVRIAGDTLTEANELFYLALNMASAVNVSTSQTNVVSGEIVNDDDLVGNTLQTAQAISVNSYTNSAIEKANDQDVYAVNLVAGQRYAIGLVGLSNGLLPTFQLLDAAGMEVANVLDQTGMGVTPSASGTYYMKLQARANGSSTGDYSMVVYTEGDDVPGDATTTAALATFPDAGGLIELISDNFDADWYQATLTAGHIYRLSLVQASANIAFGQNIGVQVLDGSASHQVVPLANLTSGMLPGLDVRNFNFTPITSGSYVINVSGTVAESYPGFYFVGIEDRSIPSGDNGYQIRAMSNAVIEGDAEVTPYVFEVVRDNSASQATINWRVSGAGTSPADASDFSGAQSGTLTFQVGETVKFITVGVAGDAGLEPTETFKVSLDTPSLGVIANGYAQAYGTIRNDDGATATSDILTGSNLVDSLNGGAGDDVIAGRAGDDLLTGGSGNDILHGGDGNDTLNGGAGNDLLDGGNGLDVIEFSGPITDYRISLNPSGQDYTVEDTVAGRDGTDKVIASGEVLQFLNNAEYEIARLSTDPELSSRWLSTLSPGNDVFDFRLMTDSYSGAQITWAGASFAGALAVIGNFSPQPLTTNGVTLASYTLRDPYGGTDTVTVNGSNAPGDLTFWSGPGNDYVTFANNSTTPFIWNLSPNAGNDTVVGGVAQATIDLFFDNALNIQLQGNHGVLALGPGASVDYTNVNRWRFWGGDFTVKASANSESFEVWANSVQIDLSAGGADQINFTGWKSGNVTVTGLGTDDQLSFSIAEFGGLTSASMLALNYDAASNTTHITVNGRDGKVANIHLRGGQYQIDQLGYDPAYSWTNTVSFTLASQGLLLTGTNGNDTLTGNAGPDTIFGLTGNDTIFGGAGDDRIDPGPGSDIVNAGAGDDYIYAGGGEIGYPADDQSDTIDGGDGYDWAVYDYRFRGITTGIQFHVTEYGAAPVAEFTQVDPVNGKTDVLHNIEGIVVHGGEGDDVLYGSSRGDNFIGNNGNDTLFGMDGDDLLNGAYGNDAVYGGNGNDYIQKGGNGNDTIDGGAGIDTYQISFDWVTGSGIHFQSSWAGNGSYVQSLPGGFHDSINGIEQIQIFGTGYNDTLTGDASNNRVEGLDGNDILEGGDGNDALVGGAGDDTLDGGSGIDTAIYRGNKSAYAIEWNSSTVWVTDIGSGYASGHDTLNNLESLQFDDQTINIGSLIGLPPVTVTVAPALVHENPTELLTYTFTRTGSASQALNFTVALSGSAQPGLDYDIVYPDGAGPAISVDNSGPAVDVIRVFGNTDSETLCSISQDNNGGLVLFANSAATNVSTPMVMHMSGSTGEVLKTESITSVGGNTFIRAGWAFPNSDHGDYFVVGQTYASQIDALNMPYPGSGDAFFGAFNLPGNLELSVSSSAAKDNLTALTAGSDPSRFPYEMTGTGPNVLYAVGGTGSDTLGWNATLSQIAATGDFQSNPSATAYVSWTRTIDSGGNDFATGVATGPDGAVYVVGYTQAALDGQAYHGGTQDAFLIKYSAQGNKIWTRLLGGTGDDRATGVATNAQDGSVYVTGTTLGGMGQDAFVTRVSATGQTLWSQTIDSGADDTSKAIVADDRGNVYIGGSTSGSLNKTNAGLQDAYVARISDTGIVQWKEQGGTVGNDAVTALTLSEDQNTLYIGGQAGAAFDGANYGGGDSDIFVAKATNLDGVSYSLGLTLQPGQTSTTLNVAPRSDALPEPVETVTLSIIGGGATTSATSTTSAASGSTTASGSDNLSSATGIILNTAPLEGLVYDWKSHQLLQGVNLHLVPQSDGVSHLFELKDIQLAANGDFVAQVWANLGSQSVQNLEFDLSLTSGVGGVFQANATNLTGFSVFDGDQPDHVNFAAISLSSSLSGAVLLGDLTLRMPVGMVQSTLNFASGMAGERAMPSYAVSIGADSAATDSHGAYAFTPLQQGTYDLSLDKPLSSADTSTVAINSADALAALKLAVGRNPNGEAPSALAASPYQFIAADINDDGKVTSADALAILKMVVKRSDAPSSDWLFVRENEDFWNEDTGKFTTTRTAVSWEKEPIELQSPITSQQNFVAVLKGDVNGSWVAPAGSTTLDNSYFEALVAQHPDTMQLAQWAVQPILTPILTPLALI